MEELSRLSQVERSLDIYREAVKDAWVYLEYQGINGNQSLVEAIDELVEKTEERIWEELSEELHKKNATILDYKRLIEEFRIAGTLSAATDEEDFESYCRAAAYDYIKLAVSLWPGYEDLAVFLETACLQAGVIGNEALR